MQTTILNTGTHGRQGWERKQPCLSSIDIPFCLFVSRTTNVIYKFIYRKECPAARKLARFLLAGTVGVPAPIKTTHQIQGPAEWSHEFEIATAQVLVTGRGLGGVRLSGSSSNAISMTIMAWNFGYWAFVIVFTPGWLTPLHCDISQPTPLSVIYTYDYFQRG